MADIEQKIADAEAAYQLRESKALLAWSNSFLLKRKLKVNSVFSDFADGVLLINLVEVCFGVSLGKYDISPKMPFHKMANIQVVFKYLEEVLRIKLLGIDTNDLVKKQDKQTINVLWNILRGLAIKGMQGDGDGDGKNINFRQRLLDWAASILEGTGITVKDFWESFKDGIAFCAIVDNLCPESKIDVESLSPDNAESNLNLAFSTAESQLGIPPLLQAADLAVGKKTR